MHQTLHSSRAAEAILDVPRASLLYMADRLPVTRHGRPGKMRRWSVKDLCVIHLANRFADAGLQPAAVYDMATAAEKRFIDILTADGERGATFYLIAILKPDQEGRFSCEITEHVIEAVTHLGTAGVAIFDLTMLVGEAMNAILAHEKAKEAPADD